MGSHCKTMQISSSSSTCCPYWWFLLDLIFTLEAAKQCQVCFRFFFPTPRHLPHLPFNLQNSTGGKMPSFSCFLPFSSSLPLMIGIISQHSFLWKVHNSLWYLIILMLKLSQIWPMGDLQALSYIVKINHPSLFWMLPLWCYTWPWNLPFQQGVLIFFFFFLKWCRGLNYAPQEDMFKV